MIGIMIVDSEPIKGGEGSQNKYIHSRSTISRVTKYHIV